MSDQVSATFVQNYHDTLQYLVQQKGSRLRTAVRVEGMTGQTGFFDQIGAVEAVERIARHADSPLVHTPHARRRVAARDFEWGDLIDTQDKLKMLAEPGSSYVQSAAWALGRKMDDLIIQAAFGTAYTGQTGATSIDFPAEQQVAAGAAGLTLAKLLSAKELLDAADADPDEPRFVACSAKQISDLLSTTEVKSADYNTVKALVQGQIDTFLGFKFIRTERLLTNSSSERRVMAWCQPGLLLAVNGDIEARITERPDKAFALYAYAKMSAGAVRMEEDRVVEIPCVES
ncbi:MAG: phage capsid protein [Pseudomonadota bacterium]|nr:phage capsid protein [Pseudomonadota bacterium]